MQAWKRRFFSHRVGEGAKDKMALVRGVLIKAGGIVQETVPEGREKSLAMTKLEEAMFWANAGVSRLSEDSELDDESAFERIDLNSMMAPKLQHQVSKRPG